MTAKLTAFQKATVDAAVRALTDPQGARRFLIADETGLGKTVVARGVIERMRTLKPRRGRPFRVYYVTSGQRIAHQNRSRLLDFLPQDDVQRALVKAGRLCLVPMEQRTASDVELFALTPYTSFPDEKKRQGMGRKDERAFMTMLLNQIAPRLSARLPPKLMQGRVSDVGWSAQLQLGRRSAAATEDKMKSRLHDALVRTFGAPLEETLPAAARATKPMAFVSRLRRCLSLAVLQAFPPDIVVLDEFQKFRDLLTAHQQDDLVKCLFSGTREHRPAVLLLSATPYRTYATRWEEEDDAAHVQLFELVEFLGGDHAGKDIRLEAERLFHEFGSCLHQIPRLEQDQARQAAEVGRARQVKKDLEGLLTRLMSRTERALIARMESHDQAAEEFTIELAAQPTPADIAAYRHLVDGFNEVDRPDAVPYWLSVPLAAQALGPRYQAWKRAKFTAERGIAKITKASIEHPHATADWSHPKLRALKQVEPTHNLVTPWVGPSLAWWPLRGAWAEQSASPKLLLFGRFRATPQSVAALTSLAAEAHSLGRGDDVGATRKRRRLRARGAQMPVFALFHPSPFLTECVDPLLAAGSTLEAVRRSAIKQISAALKGVLPIRGDTKKKRTRRRPTWIVLANIERRLGPPATVAAAAWQSIPEVRLMLDQWHKAPALDWISPMEVRELADLAISSPGVVCARALRRHQVSSFTPTELVKLAHLCWKGLRTYLDEPIFYAKAPRREAAAETIRRLVLDGCLESALDEHFWMKTRSGARTATALMDELFDALKLNAGAFTFRSLQDPRQGLRVRCHAAVPFGGTDDESYKEPARGAEAHGAPARADEIREAFNTPFWPHIVATTSVGQEGLDFHTWCDRVAHWDLCPSPVELEQREGRVHRYAGLMVRKKLAQVLGTDALYGAQRLDSAWSRLEQMAEANFPGGSGMSPWWQVAGATIHRYVFRLPMSRDIERFKTLREQRLIYRLALGQPNSEDLIASLAVGSDDTRKLLQSLVLNLSAYARGIGLADKR
ncbi:hypothetical protein LJR084_002440 [Variovorax sp. LjRoot84]|uniref:helicase-related protein n=1 Tax=Variovorax sp. LjRoot84 TaxID=3342340 RepID=UPI003ECD7682